jgi:predicted PurR-regulated permease PerM
MANLERERFAIVLFYGIVLLIGYLAFQVIAPFLVPLAWAAIFAMVLSPYNKRLASRIGQTSAALTTTIATFLMIVVPTIMVGTLLVHEVSGQIQSANASGMTTTTPAKLQQMWDLVRTQMPFLHLPADPTANAQEAIRSVAAYAAARAASIVTDVANFVLQLFIMLFGLFYFLRDSTPMVSLIRQMLPFEPDRRDRIVDETHDLVVATVGATFAVAVTQGTITGITMGLLGFSAPAFWGVMTSFTSLLPVVGAGVIWVPAAIWLFLSGDIVRAVILIGVGVGVVGTVDNVLRQVLLTGRTTMHGLLVFVSLLGGVAAFGFIGLVIGPVVVAAAATLLEAVLTQAPKGDTAA